MCFLWRWQFCFSGHALGTSLSSVNHILIALTSGGCGENRNGKSVPMICFNPGLHWIESKLRTSANGERNLERLPDVSTRNCAQEKARAVLHRA